LRAPLDVIPERTLNEYAILAAMLIYADNRALGYLKPNNLKESICGNTNAEVYEALQNADNISQIQKLMRANILSPYKVFSFLVSIPFDIDHAGINVPKYALCILQAEFRVVFLAELYKLIKKATPYRAFVEEVYIDTVNTEAFHVENVEVTMAYFDKIGYDEGGDMCRNMIGTLGKRIRQIDQKLSIRRCISELVKMAYNKDELVVKIKMLENEF
jgi:hypothetical protein